MAEQQLNAPPRASSGARAGVTHVRFRHTERFTVVGNHLAQHGELSLVAIGLALHIQSLPDGARVDIKTLAERFPEGETRIAAALRELEAHGYLERAPHRLPGGRLCTRTVFHDHPRPAATRRPRPSGPRRPEPTARRARPAQPARPPRSAGAASRPAHLPPQAAVRTAAFSPVPPPHPTLPNHALPHPALPTGPAAALLAGLRRDDDRLLLSQRDVQRLSPGVTAWLERGVTPEAVRHVLTNALPEGPLRHPAGLLAHRLSALAPPHLPSTPPPAPRPHPLQSCDGCDRAFRSPTPGRCRYCRHAAVEADAPTTG